MVAFWDRFKRKPKVGARVSAPVGNVPTRSELSSAARRPSVEDTGAAPRVLLRPLRTEKASRLAAARQYVFAVERSATRLAVARAVLALYGVRPTGVNIIRVKGKQVRFGRRLGREKNWKKAVITLPPGKSIAVYEGV